MDDLIRLCDACKHSLGKLQKSATVAEHHASLAALTEAAAFCALCKRIDTIRSTATEEKTALVRLPHEGHEDTSVEIRSISYTGQLEDIEHPENKESSIYAFFRLESITQASDRLNIPEYSPESSTASDSCLALARSWLQKCSSQHVSCERPRETVAQKTWRPTRLIAVGSSPVDIHLVEKDGIQPGVKYVTLSHRWGHLHSNVVLGANNIEQWKVNVPSLAGSKAISDAVDIARRLGFAHIWIDSLCIIQDSAEDWRRECTLMSNVYKYSQLNISATSARDNSSGCYWERDLSRVLPLRLAFDDSGVTIQSPSRHVTLSDQSESPRNPGHWKGVYDLHLQQTWMHDIKESPLYSRGWVLQERLLTARVLNFASSQLYWECDELQASESYPYDMPDEPYTHTRFKRLNPFTIARLKADDDGSRGSRDGTTQQSRFRREAFRVWAGAVQAYTQPDIQEDGEWLENLTFPSDKLVAISAVARELKPYMDCEYLAGHWRTGLVRQLGWTGLNWSEVPPAYRAPSWSWASVSGVIPNFCDYYDSYELDGIFELAEVLDVRIELVTTDEMGQVKGGSLLIRGRLLQLDVRSLLPTRYGRQDDEEEGYPKEQIFHAGRRTVLHVQRDDELNGIATPCQLFCLPLEIRLGGTSQFNAILLERAGEPDTYRRVGFFGENIFRDLTQSEVENDPVLQALGTVDWSKPPATRFEQNREGLVDITII